MTIEFNDKSARFYAFGPFVLVPERQLLLRDDTPVRIGGRALDILTALVECPGEVLTKHVLMARAWPNIIVEESNLKVNIAALRRALGEVARGSSYIATVTGRGYRFVADVAVSAWPESAPGVSWANPRRHNLPVATARLIGREECLERIGSDLQSRPLVAIVGPGGAGKTTLALAAADAALPDYRDGVWWVDLTVLSGDAVTPDAIAAITAIGGHSGSTCQALCAFLRERHSLLVFDNCEHVIDAAATCIETILNSAPQVRILATSREPLRVRGERVRRLQGLAAPPAFAQPSASEALTYPAVQLFVERATEGWECFRVTDENAPPVAEICRRLDGLALAIELAAARVESFGVVGLLAQLTESFNLLSGRRAVPARHHNLAATIAWSYDLLSPAEQGVIRRLAVFVGTFSLEAACAVAVDASTQRREVINSLARLVARSLVTAELRGDDLVYRQSETTRSYMIERLGESGDGDRTRRCHAQFMLAWFERGEAEWAQIEAKTWAERYVPTLADLRIALCWAFGERGDPSLGVRLAAAAVPLWSELAVWAQGSHWARTALSRAQQMTCDDGLKAKLAWFSAFCTLYDRELPPGSTDPWRLAIELAERAGDAELLRQCLLGQARYFHRLGHLSEAISCLEKPAWKQGNSSGTYIAADRSRALAWIKSHRGEIDESRRILQQLEPTPLADDEFAHVARSDVHRIIANRCSQTFNAFHSGQADSAADFARGAVEVASATECRVSEANALGLAALPLALETGDTHALEHYAQQMHANLQRQSIGAWQPIQNYYFGNLRSLQGDVKGVGQVRDAVDELLKGQQFLRVAIHLGGLARVLIQHGLYREAKQRMTAAMHYQALLGESWCLPELLRVQAKIVLREGEVDLAEKLLRQAVSYAQGYGFAGFGLRAANDLAMHYFDRGRFSEAAAILAPLVRAFSVGSATTDLTLARQLLAGC